MTTLALSDPVIVSIISLTGTIFSVLTTSAITILLWMMNRRAAREAERAAVEAARMALDAARIEEQGIIMAELVEDVRTDLTHSNEKTDKTLDDLKIGVEETKAVVDATKEIAENTNSLVNGAMTAALRAAAIALRRVADMSRDQRDVEAAEIAEKAYAEHAAKNHAAASVEQVKDRVGQLEARADDAESELRSDKARVAEGGEPTS